MSDRLSPHIREPATLADVIDALASIAARHLAKLAAEVEVFLDLHFGVKRDVFREISQGLAHLLGLMEDIKAIDARPATGGRQITRQHLQRGRFSRAVWPEESDDLPFGHIKADMVNRQCLAVFFGQIFDRNHVSSFCNSAKSRPRSCRGGKYVCAKAGAVKGLCAPSRGVA